VVDWEEPPPWELVVSGTTKTVVDAAESSTDVVGLSPEVLLSVWAGGSDVAVGVASSPLSVVGSEDAGRGGGVVAIGSSDPAAGTVEIAVGTGDDRWAARLEA
jgi:hypothetical protein